MNYLIKKYIDKLTINDINTFALNNNIYLSKEELLFIYNLVKQNSNIKLNELLSLDITKYKNNISNTNYNKIKSLVTLYQSKYKNIIKGSN